LHPGLDLSRGEADTGDDDNAQIDRARTTEGHALTTNSPHDALFRTVFSRQEEAVGALRVVLPHPIASAIDWTTLALDNGTFIDEDLERSESDLLFTANIAGDEALIYVLFEHQSSPGGNLMALRLLRYMQRIWDRWLSNHRDAKRLPAILPVVLSHAEHGWNAPTSMLELYDLSEAIRPVMSPHLPSFTFLLDDIQRTSDDELMSRPLTARAQLALLLLKHARDARGLLERLAGWASLLRRILGGHRGVEEARPLVHYALLVAEGSRMQDIKRWLEPEIGETATELIMTLGEELIARGRAEGETRGEVRAKAGAVLTVLTARQISISAAERERIDSCTDVATIDRWIARAATAKSTAEALADI
jgi:predicted transposase/invertase (TIGR01784 family)